MQTSPQAFESEAFEVAVAALHARAWRWSLSADNIQQAALELWGHEGRQEPTSRSRTMLLIRARSRSVDDLRMRARRAIVPLEVIDSLGEAHGEGAGSDDHCDAIDAARWAALVQARIPTEHEVGWRAWRMRVELGLDNSQIAQQLAMSPDALRQRLSRCARWIQKHVPADPPIRLAA